MAETEYTIVEQKRALSVGDKPYKVRKYFYYVIFLVSSTRYRLQIPLSGVGVGVDPAGSPPSAGPCLVYGSQ